MKTLLGDLKNAKGYLREHLTGAANCLIQKFEESGRLSADEIKRAGDLLFIANYTKHR